MMKFSVRRYLFNIYDAESLMICNTAGDSSGRMAFRILGNMTGCIFYSY